MVTMAAVGATRILLLNTWSTTEALTQKVRTALEERQDIIKCVHRKNINNKNFVAMYIAIILPVQ